MQTVIKTVYAHGSEQTLNFSFHFFISYSLQLQFILRIDYLLRL